MTRMNPSASWCRFCLRHMLSGSQGGSFGHIEFPVCEAVQAGSLHIGEERWSVPQPKRQERLRRWHCAVRSSPERCPDLHRPLVRRVPSRMRCSMRRLTIHTPSRSSSWRRTSATVFTVCVVARPVLRHWTWSALGQSRRGEYSVVGLDASALIRGCRLARVQAAKFFVMASTNGLRRGIARPPG
jgi:hypothetical protein